MRAAIAAMAAAVAALAAGAEAGAGEHLLERWDEDADGALSEAEVAEMLEALGAAAPACPSAHDLLNATNIPEGALVASDEDLDALALNLVPCMIELLADPKLTIVAGDETYTCHAGEHEEHDDHDDHDEDHEEDDDDHDDHDHTAEQAAAAGGSDRRRRRQLAADEHDHGAEEEGELEISATLGARTLECHHVEEEQHEEELVITAAMWGNAIGATMLACAASLFGIVIILGLRNGASIDTGYINDAVAFAVGVLLAAVFLHMIPEGVAFAGGFDLSSGLTLLGGVLCAFAIELVASTMGHSSHHHDPHDLDVSSSDQDRPERRRQRAASDSAADSEAGLDVEEAIAEPTFETAEEKELREASEVVEDGKAAGKRGSEHAHSHASRVFNVDEIVGEDKDATVKVGHPQRELDYSLITNVVIGDGLHNVTDGIVIGIAFSLCAESNLGWITLAAVLCHELPQELVDFIILVRAGLSFKMALFWNFVSSLGALFGTVIILAVGANLPERGRGLLLVFGAGFLAYIALAELAPALVKLDTPSRKAFRLFLAVAGVALIAGLSHFDVHCEPEGSGHDH